MAIRRGGAGEEAADALNRASAARKRVRRPRQNPCMTLRGDRTMAFQEMFLRAPSPGPDEIVVERTSESCAEHRNNSPGPLFHDLAGHFRCDAVHDPRHQPLAGLLFYELPPEIEASRASRCHP